MVINTREKSNVTIIDIAGELRRSTISNVTLHQFVKDQLDIGKKNILLNFEKIEFIDSFGVGEILASYISTNNIGGNLKILKIPNKYYLVFQVTMLTKVIEIFDEEEKALKSFL